MWQHYRKTFVRMQVVIWLVALSVYLFFGHQLTHAIMFLVVMQWSAVIGATWAARIQASARHKAVGLPLEPRD